MFQLIGICILIVLGVFGKRFFNGGVCKLESNLKDKVVFITGANTGIGQETAIELAKKGAQIIIACRNIKKAKTVITKIEKIANKPILIPLDLSDLQSVKDCVEKFKETSFQQIDILINNAGVMAVQKRALTQQNFEMQFGVNHIGHFYLTHLLMPFLEKSKNPRIINVSSEGHKMGDINFKDVDSTNQSFWSFRTYKAYGTSKLANIVHAKELSRRFGNKLKAVSLHPGVVRTELTRHQQQALLAKILWPIASIFFYYFGKNPLQGAQTTLYCALLEYDKLMPGGYYKDCQLTNIRQISNQQCENLWEISENLIRKRYPAHAL